MLSRTEKVSPCFTHGVLRHHMIPINVAAFTARRYPSSPTGHSWPYYHPAQPPRGIQCVEMSVGCRATAAHVRPVGGGTAADDAVWCVLVLGGEENPRLVSSSSRRCRQPSQERRRSQFASLLIAPKECVCWCAVLCSQSAPAAAVKWKDRVRRR